jgi:hypothetical protein
VKAKFAWFIGSGLLGLSALVPPAQGAEDAAATRKPVMINRLYTGPDGQTHVEEIEAKFAPSGETGGYKLLVNASAEPRRAPPGRVGPLRVDYAYPTSKASTDVTQRLHFGVGAF